jgi:hypothetical protein
MRYLRGMPQKLNLVGGFNHLEKWEQLSHILWKIKNV